MRMKPAVREKIRSLHKRGVPVATHAQEIYDALEALPAVPQENHKRINIRDVLADHGADFVDVIIPKLQAVAAERPSIQIALAAFQDTGPDGGLDMAHAETVRMVRALEAAGVLTKPERQALLTYGRTEVSWRDANGGYSLAAIEQYVQGLRKPHVPAVIVDPDDDVIEVDDPPEPIEPTPEPTVPE